MVENYKVARASDLREERSLILKKLQRHASNGAWGLAEMLDGAIQDIDRELSELQAEAGVQL